MQIAVVDCMEQPKEGTDMSMKYDSALAHLSEGFSKRSPRLVEGASRLLSEIMVHTVRCFD